MKKNPISTTIESFLRVADIATGAKARREKDTEEFMAFYRELVETLPAEACKLFGNMGDVKFSLGETDSSGGIELSVKDYLWWKYRTDKGMIFKEGSSQLKLRMVHQLAEKAERANLNPQERQALLNILDPKGTIEGMA